jgi:hypothetical protein
MIKILPHSPPFVFGILYTLKCATSSPPWNKTTHKGGWKNFTLRYSQPFNCTLKTSFWIDAPKMTEQKKFHSNVWSWVCYLNGREASLPSSCNFIFFSPMHPSSFPFLLNSFHVPFYVKIFLLFVFQHRGVFFVFLSFSRK